jgi:transcription factor CP2-like protein
MGIISTENGDHVTLLSEDVHLAPGFPSSYDSPAFYTGDQTPGRLYSGDRYSEDLYPGEPGYRGSYSTFPSTDLPSPDSGIGEQITPRGMVDNDTSFEFSKEPYSTQQILNENTIRKPWHDYGSRNSDTEKIQIPKVFSPFGFHYILEAPTSSSVRREDDKVTYVNKGQFYGVTLDYQPDSELPSLKSPTVKSIIMLVFRDGKSEEEEIKAWQFWHQRQHSVKQRIMDVDTKNSLGLVGHIEELSHNALAVYWNPLDSPAKVNLAVQCLSTDFSTQKGVKGLPLHVQIDTYDDPRAEVGDPPSHRGYCQVKIFCDKGAERKLRDEERRAAKRRMTPSGKRRLDEMYHETLDRSEFYSMSELSKIPTLFTPPEDQEKSSQHSTDFPGFVYPAQRPVELMKPLTNGDLHPGLMGVSAHLSEKTVLPYSDHKAKRPRIIPPTSERIMVYVRQETEDVYTPLHLVPPTVPGLISSIENKYKINASNIRFLYRKNKDGIIAKIDDDMLRHYCNEDVFLMQVMVTEGPGGSEDTMVYDITLSEIQSAMEH